MLTTYNRPTSWDDIILQEANPYGVGATLDPRRFYRTPFGCGVSGASLGSAIGGILGRTKGRLPWLAGSKWEDAPLKSLWFEVNPW